MHRIHYVTIEFIHLLDEADYSASQCFDDNVDYDNPDTSGMVQLMNWFNDNGCLR